MVRDRRWVLAMSTIAACFLVAFSVETPSSGCPLIARTSEDLQNFLNSSVIPACNTINLRNQEYTLLPFNLSGSSTKRSIVGTQQNNIYSIIRYNASSHLSRVFDGAQLNMSRIAVYSTSKGGFLRVSDSGSQINLVEVDFRQFHLTESAIIEANENTKISLKESNFLNSRCTLLQSIPKSCKRGVLYLGPSSDSVESNSLVHEAEFSRVTIYGFIILGVDGKLSNDGFGGLVLSSSGTIHVNAGDFKFEEIDGVALFADGGSTSEGRVYITRDRELASFAFSDISAPSCAILLNTEANISWSFFGNNVVDHVFYIRKSVLRARWIILGQSLRVFTNTSRGALLAAELSDIYAKEIEVMGTNKEPSSLAGLRLNASFVSAETLQGSKLDPAIHLLPSPLRTSILNVSNRVELLENMVGMIVEFTESDPLPVMINTSSLFVSSNGKPVDNGSISGGIHMKNTLTGTLKYSSYLDINAAKVMYFDDNYANQGGAIFFTVPFSLNSPSISFRHNHASAGGVYYSQDPRFADFIPGELFKNTTAYTANMAVYGCIIAFANGCPALQPFNAAFLANQNVSYDVPVPVQHYCPISDSYCHIVPPPACPHIPNFGLPTQWVYRDRCHMVYRGNLEIPAGASILAPMEVEGEIKFIEPTPGDPSAPTYSLIMTMPAKIRSPNHPIVLPKLPISYTVTRASSRVIIFQANSTINAANPPTVDFFVSNQMPGLTFTCANESTNPKEFGFERCRFIKVQVDTPSKPSSTSSPKMAIIIALSVVGGILVVMTAVLVTYCLVKKRSGKTGTEQQPLLSDIEY